VAAEKEEEEEEEDWPIREEPVPFAYPPATPTSGPALSTGSTKILTISREGITRLRTYPLHPADEGNITPSCLQLCVHV